MAYTARAAGVAAAGLLAFGLSASPAFAEEEDLLGTPVEEAQEAVEDVVGDIVVPEAPGIVETVPQAAPDVITTLELSVGAEDAGAGGGEDPPPGGGGEDPSPEPPPVDPSPTPPPDDPEPTPPPVDPSPSPEPPDPSPAPEDPAPGPDPDDDADDEPSVTVVVEEASTGGGTGDGELPVTGGALENLVLGGVLATGIGAMTLLGARRRTPLAE